MAGINLNFPLRPCYVDSRKAMFHMWGTFGDGVDTVVLGIVEFENGDVRKVYPERIRFLDNSEFEKWDWSVKG